MTIVVLALFAMSVIWPMGIFNISETSGGKWDGMRFSGPCNETDIIRQEFSPMFSNLKSIGVYVCNEPDSIDTMKVALRVYTYDGKCISEEIVNLEDYELPGWVSIPVDLNGDNTEVEPGTLYYYTVGGHDGDLIVGLCNDELKTPENGFLYYKEVYSGGTTATTRFEYIRPLGLKKIVFYDGIIAVFAVALLSLVCRNSDNADRILKAEKITKIVLCIFLGAGLIVSFYGIVVKHLFIDDVLNTTILFCGSALFIGLLGYLTLTCKSSTDTIDEKYACQVWIKVLRAILFAVTFIMVCMYQNGFTDYEKNLYVCRAIAFFALFMFSFGSANEIFGIKSIVWTLIAVIFGIVYTRINNDHIEHLTTAKAISFVVWASGLLILSLIQKVKNNAIQKYKQICPAVAIMTIIFWIACAILAHGKSWPIILIIVFVVWFVFYLLENDKKNVIEAVCNGSIVMLFAIIIFCVFRRPYHFYFLNRYGGIFFTVTVTAAMYLVPISAICVKLIKARREDDKKKVFLLTLMFGTAFSYMLFTASRTGLITSALLLIIAFCVPLEKPDKGFVINQLKLLGISLISLLVTFVISFSVTRMVPAIIANPYYYPYEENCDVIPPGAPWNGGPTWDIRYIEIERVIELLTGRVLDIDNSQFVRFEEKVDTNSNIEMSEAVSDYSNGRIEIYKTYLSKLNLTGHDDMTLTADNGEELYHAHNSYIQVLYDFGIPVGIMFIILCGVVFIRAIIMFVRKASKIPEYSFVLLIVSAFGLASMTEWLYHPFAPLGFMFLICWVILMCKIDGEKENVKTTSSV